MRRTALAVSVLAIAAFAVVGSAGAAATYRTSVFLNEAYPPFHGKVHSAKPFCERNRRVRIYRRQHGEVRLLGVDRSDRNGSWFVDVRDVFTSGEYWALTPRKASSRFNIVCRWDRSEIVFVD